jgi:hypothetical protein
MAATFTQEEFNNAIESLKSEMERSYQVQHEGLVDHYEKRIQEEKHERVLMAREIDKLKEELAAEAKRKESYRNALEQSLSDMKVETVYERY